MKKTCLAPGATVSFERKGKAAEQAGESEDLPYQYAIALRATESVVK
jgi:hypothetical protein